MNFDVKYISPFQLGSWEQYSQNLHTEMRQCTDEGRDVARYAALCDAICALPEGETREELADIFFRAMISAPIRPDFPYREPDELEEIRAARPADRPSLPAPARTPRLTAQIRGAWLGRICGCLLGKPIEGMRTPDILELLKNSGNFPLRRYMTLEDVQKTPRLLENWEKRTWADVLPGRAPADDDTNYTVIAAKCIVDRFGRDFTSDDVVTAWLDNLPKCAVFTAERRAFRNFVAGIRAPQSALYKNPDREYIGAQIRADYFGYINPGDPQTAAGMAWRDARISHVKNGIYGEMFVAAMIAAAAVCDDVQTVIRAGLGEIPASCRLAESIRTIVQEYNAGVPEDECFRRIAARWDEFKAYDWVHTISNAEIVVASLLYGRKDYSLSICRAVQTGFDTDCNGATVGSILGMMLGAEAIDTAWTAPIHNTLSTNIFDMEKVGVDDLVNLTLSHLPL